MTKENNNEELIRQKIQAGLTRDQALEVIANQEAHDEALENQKPVENTPDKKPKKEKAEG